MQRKRFTGCSITTIDSFLNDYVKEHLVTACNRILRGKMLQGFGLTNVDIDDKTEDDIRKIVEEWVKNDAWKTPPCKEHSIKLTSIEIIRYNKWLKLEFEIERKKDSPRKRDGEERVEDGCGCRF